MLGELAVCVVAVWGGWSVRCDEVDHPLMFLSGAKAEARAHDLGRRLAKSGRTTRVTIHERQHVPLATTFYFADDPADPALSTPSVIRLTHPISTIAPLPEVGARRS